MKEISVICPYDNFKANLVDGSVIYPHRVDLKHKYFYKCPNCGAYVGCYPGSSAPLGRLANAELRVWKSKAHELFDPLWKNGFWGTRREVYSTLAEKLGVSEELCHIGMFDIDMCKKVVKVVQEFIEDGVIS